jgi:hypothetical protein
MPPQPLLKVCSNATVELSLQRVIERPQVAAWIAECIACWSIVEYETSRLFTLLLDVNVEAGMELYNQFGGASLKESGIKALARSKLHRKDFEIIEALLKAINSHEKTRNKIAHWYWGISDQVPDGLVLIDPKELLILSARIRDKAINRKKGERTKYDFGIPLDNMYAYRIKDLRLDAAAFSDLAILIKKCHGLCYLRSGPALFRLRRALSQDDRLMSLLSRSTSAGR